MLYNVDTLKIVIIISHNEPSNQTSNKWDRNYSGRNNETVGNAWNTIKNHNHD